MSSLSMVGFGIITHIITHCRVIPPIRQEVTIGVRTRENTFVNSGNFNHLSLRPTYRNVNLVHH